MPHIVYLALGTNLGNRLENLAAARSRLGSVAQVLACSPVYETPPWGYQEQPAFLNQVIKAESNLSPQELLAHLKSIEAQMGRQPVIRFGPRLIDLDILLYDDLVLNVPGLSIPHPRLAERAFVLVPLVDLAPDLRHPRLGSTMRELLEQVDRTDINPYANPC
jgi:2-amino-4-hydroxy-6-hydroxymethyldihydropteridine diphosphokinase